MPRSHTEVEALLLNLQQVMQACHCWSAETPSPEALASRLPFACDTLSFEQWLQFIFIPVLPEYLDQNGALPHAMGLLAMGEQCLLDDTQRSQILPVLAAIDRLFEA